MMERPRQASPSQAGTGRPAGKKAGWYETLGRMAATRNCPSSPD